MTYVIGSVDSKTDHSTKYRNGEEVILRTSGEVMRVVGASKDVSGKTWYALRRKRVPGGLRPQRNQADAYAHADQLEPLVRM